MSIIGIDHVNITIPVGAEVQAKTFYCGLLGLTEIEKPDSLKMRGGFWLQVGTQSVHISVEDGIDRHKSKAHIAYRVDDLEVWRTKLSQQGITIKTSTPIPNFDRFECRDPFGNRVEIIALQKHTLAG